MVSLNTLWRRSLWLRGRRVAQGLLGLALTGVLLYWALAKLDLPEVQRHLRNARFTPLLFIALLAPAQIALSARRWNLAASQLGVGLAPSVAFAEYLLSSVLNQLLPGGSAGDLIRVWRHKQGRALGPTAAAALLERALGLFWLLTLCALGLLVWPIAIDAPRPDWLWGPVAGVMVAMLAWVIVPARVWGTRLAPAMQRCKSAVVGKVVRAEQAGLSVLLAVSYVLGLAMAVSAVGIELSPSVLVVLPLVLLAMALPLALGGWGPREAAAVILVPMAGGSGESAFAMGVVYGAAVLVGSLPGLLFLWFRPKAEAPGPRPLGRSALSAPLIVLLLNTLLVAPRVIYRPREFRLFDWQSFVDAPKTLLVRGGEDLWRVFAELWLGVTLMVLCRWWWPRRVALARRITLAVWSVLMFVELNNLVGQLLMNQQPLLYDELRLLMHLRVLLADLWNPKMWAGLIAALLLLTLLGRVLPRLFRVVSDSLSATPTRALAWYLVPWPVIAAASVMTGFAHQGTAAIWTTPALADNVSRSVAVWSRVHRDIAESPYRALADVRLQRRPDLDIHVVESYGRLIAEEPRAARMWRDTMLEIDYELSRRGWHIVSAYSRAPVSGGRSWLADASVLMGLPIEYESVYRHLLSNIERIPTLVSFLREQGYSTVRLAPGDRTRAGIHRTNEWQFDGVIGYEELRYGGVREGWGVIPDEYSLQVYKEELEAQYASPRFLFFHMVSAHAPWWPPNRIGDWRKLRREQEIDTELYQDKSALKETHDRLFRYRREPQVREMYMGKLESLDIEKYAQAVVYDLRILFEMLAADERNGLVIIMGDHQPPIISRYTDRFDVPVHALSKDPMLLEELLGWGFRQGMVPPVETERTLRHEDMFGVLVRALARADGREPPKALAPWARGNLERVANAGTP